jgi:GrpB-like predicted nucleotidyltransferase (UPF0157 family)
MGYRTRRSRRGRPQLDCPGEQERDHLQTLLAPWVITRIEHVGSTAIPGLLAKPIIDLQAPVAETYATPTGLQRHSLRTTGTMSLPAWTSDPGGASSSKSPTGGAAPTFTS